jgi:hypothetical protein
MTSMQTFGNQTFINAISPTPGELRPARLGDGRHGGDKFETLPRLNRLDAPINVKTALNSVGGDFERVVKITTCLTDEQNADAYRVIALLNTLPSQWLT